MSYSEIEGEKSSCPLSKQFHVPLIYLRVSGTRKEFCKKDIHHSAIYNNGKLEIQMSAIQQKRIKYMVYSEDEIICSHQKVHI